MGAEQRIPVRLLAVRVPQEVFDQRRRRLREAHRAKGKVPNARTLALLAWTIVVTSVPVERLSVPEALVLLRARWQIEVLFKVWKSQAAVDEWRSEQPWRILCEVYAKLLGMVIRDQQCGQHVLEGAIGVTFPKVLPRHRGCELLLVGPYGYDRVTLMQETKTTLCEVARFQA